MFAYCGNNPVSRADDGGEWWNVVVGAVVGGVTSLVSAVASELIEGDVTWSDIGQIAISTIIGTAEGAAVAAFPAMAVAISATASAVDTAINGMIDGDSVGEIVTNSLIAAGMGAITGSTGSEFVKGGKLINNAVESITNVVSKGVHPVVKKAAKKSIRRALKQIGREYIYGQIEDLAYTGIQEISNLCTEAIFD